MPARTRRSIRLRRLVLAVTIGVAASFLPLPVLSFAPVASASTTQVTGFRPLGEEAAEEQDAVAEEGLDPDVDRLVARETAAGEFSMIGAAFEELPSQPVLARVHSSDDSWGEWFELEVSGDEGPDTDTTEFAAAADRVHTEPVWVDDSTGYELSVGADDADAVAVTLVTEATERVVVDSTPIAGSSPLNPVGVRSRSTWGARPAISTSTTTSLGLAVVHHTASTNNYTAAQVPGILRSTQAYHMDGRGWSDIAYNFLVDRFGSVWEGRGGGIDRAVIGAHAAGFNTGSVGVSVIGNFVGVSTPAVVLERVSQVIGWRLGAYGLDPRSNGSFRAGSGSTRFPVDSSLVLPRVVGHQDVGQTSCPGSILGSLPSVRNRAKQWADSYSNPIGSLDAVTVEGRRVSLRGWAYDPNTTSAIPIHAVAGGVWKTATASRSRPDVGAALPGVGSNRGYEVTFDDVAPGAWNVCAYGINQGPGSANTALGCRSIVVK